MRKCVAVMVLIFISCSLSALPMELHLGGNFLADRDYISRDTSDNFLTMSEPGYYIDNIRRLGLGVELTYFPYAPIKVGLTFNYQLLMPIGFQRMDADTGADDGVTTYINYSFNAKHNLSLGLSYYLLFMENLGMYFDAGGTASIHTIPDRNEKNSRLEVHYSSFSEYGVYGDLGAILHHENAFYKIGLRALCTLSNNDVGFSVAITLAGGYVFSF